MACRRAHRGDHGGQKLTMPQCSVVAVQSCQVRPCVSRPDCRASAKVNVIRSATLWVRRIHAAQPRRTGAQQLVERHAHELAPLPDDGADTAATQALRVLDGQEELEDRHEREAQLVLMQQNRPGLLGARHAHGPMPLRPGRVAVDRGPAVGQPLRLPGAWDGHWSCHGSLDPPVRQMGVHGPVPHPARVRSRRGGTPPRGRGRVGPPL